MRIEPGGRKLVLGSIWWDEEMESFLEACLQGGAPRRLGVPLVDIEWGQGGMKGWDRH